MAADADGELVEYVIYGTAFSGAVIAGEVVLEGGSKSQLRGEVEEVVDDIGDMLVGEPGSKEVWTCVEVEVGVLDESGEPPIGQPNISVSFFLYLQSTSTA